MTAGEISFELRNSLSELDKLCKNLEQFCTSLGLSEKCKCEINLVLEELFVNIISYGYMDNAEHWVKITISCENGTLIIRVEDDGIPFNPVEAKRPDFEQHLEEREIGGLGIHLVKQLMNDIVYKRCGEKNVLSMKKTI